MRRLIAGLVSLLALTTAQAQLFNFGPLSLATQTTITLNVIEQTGIDVASNNPPNLNTSGKTPVTADPAKATLAILLVGDSIAANPAPTTYAPVNPILQLDIYNGLVYPAADPLLGTSGLAGGAYATPLADYVYGKFAQVVVIPTAIGGSTVRDHSPSGVLNQMSRVACFRIRGLGWIANPNFQFAIIYDVGPNDTGLGTTAAQFVAGYNAWHAAMIGYGCDFPVFVPQVSRLSGTVSTAVRAGQAAVVDNARTFAAWDTDAVTAIPANVQADLTHQTRAGNLAIGSLGNTLFRAHY
jgi:hypothetical protein